MKINYSEFCYSDRITIDGEEVHPDSLKLRITAYNLVRDLVLKHGAKDVVKTLLYAYGEFDEGSEQCEQCGNYDTIINLEI